MKTSFRSRPIIFVGTLIVVLAVLAPFVWKHLHEAHSHHESPAVLSLDNGKRWKTEEPLRTGMLRIRDAASPVLAAAGNGKLSPAQARAFADEVGTQFAYMARNCKLAPKADATLHALIVELMRGAEMLATDPQSAEGAALVSKVMRQYAEYFEHAGWTPLQETKA